jgi:small ligand-binding sensory domain FIST
MRFASGISDAVNAREAAEAVCQQVVERLGEGPCHAAFLFASPIYRVPWADLLGWVHDRVRPRVLIGCSASGVIGDGQEIEWVPGLSLVAARLPEVRLFPFAITPEEMGLSSAGGFWVDKIGASPDANPAFVVCADPYTSQPAALIQALQGAYRGRPIIGGLVSGGNEPGEHLLFLDRQVFREGVVGVAMTGNVAMDTVVSPGCRPIGRPLIITKADEDVILELKGRPALEVLHDILAGLAPADRRLAQRGSIFVGLAMDEMRQTFGSGDFLIRNIMGVDPEVGAIAVAEQVEIGQTVQFQLRDPATSRQELRRLLQQQVGHAASAVLPAGGLLFNCSGRGKTLYGLPHQDIRAIQMVGGHLPVGGFFCNGEIGPIGGATFVHGYTASLGLFRPACVPLRKAAIPPPANRQVVG